MRYIALAAFILLTGVGDAWADTCDNYKTPAQVLAGLTADDQVTQLAAKTCGLQSDDVAIRGVILKSLVNGLSTMSFDLAPVHSDTEGVKLIDKMPQFALLNINWNKDGRSFLGAGIGGNVVAAVGQLIGENLGVSFSGVTVQPAKTGDQVQVTTCAATLSLPKNGNSLVGILRCTGFAPRFTISLGI